VRVLVVGAGALGSVFGCLLRDKGHEVGLLEPSSRLDDVRELGLRATGLFGEHHCEGFALYASADDAPADYYDLVLIAVKSFHTAAAAKQIAPKVGGNALVISLQNGIGNYEAIAAEVGVHRTLAGRVIFGARMAGRAHAEVTVYAEPVMIGSPRKGDGALFSRVERIAAAFSEAGIPTEATTEITEYQDALQLLAEPALRAAERALREAPGFGRHEKPDAADCGGDIRGHEGAGNRVVLEATARLYRPAFRQAHTGHRRPLRFDGAGPSGRPPHGDRSPQRCGSEVGRGSGCQLLNQCGAIEPDPCGGVIS